jgi:hypothetical protein
MRMRESLPPIANSTPVVSPVGESAMERLSAAIRMTAVTTLPSLARSALVMSSPSSCGP